MGLDFIGEFIMKNITKVIFRPKHKAPVNCKSVEYFILTDNWGDAIKAAKKTLNKEIKLCRYYREAIATTVRVHDV